MDVHGRHALHHAASSGRGEVLKCLFNAVPTDRREAFASTRDSNGQNALHHLFQALLPGPSLATIKCLAEMNVDLNHADKNGDTPMILALQLRFTKSSSLIEIVSHLFESGADPAFRTAIEDLTLGHIAAKYLKQGRHGLLATLCKCGVDLEATDADGRSILHHFALAGTLVDEEPLNYLCDSIGLNVDAPDSQGHTPLELALSKEREYEDWTIYGTGMPVADSDWHKASSVLRGKVKTLISLTQ